MADKVLLAPGIEWLEKTVPELPEPQGKVVYVADVKQLFDAVNDAQPNTTIVLKEGTYELSDSINLAIEGIALRGESNDRSKVVLRGPGFHNEGAPPTQAINVCGGPNITVANLTITEFNIHAISVQGWEEPTPHGLHIYNVAFINNGRQNIKANIGPVGRPTPENGIIEYCYFEQNKPIPLGRPDSKGGDYTGGIDCHKVKNWIIRDNVLINIHGAKGGADAAIFIWNHSSGTTIERNLIIGCDNGIAAGNPGNPTNFEKFSKDEQYHHKGGIIRNNLIFAPNDRLGIEAFRAPVLKIYNNTVVSETASARAIRYGKDVRGLEIVNNIIVGGIQVLEDAEGEVKQSGNNMDASLEWFVNAQEGDLRLTEAGKKALNAANGVEDVSVEDVSDDFFGNSRPSEKIDSGAQQLVCGG